MAVLFTNRGTRNLVESSCIIFGHFDRVGFTVEGSHGHQSLIKINRLAFIIIKDKFRLHKERGCIFKISCISGSKNSHGRVFKNTQPSLIIAELRAWIKSISINNFRNFFPSIISSLKICIGCCCRLTATQQNRRPFSRSFTACYVRTIVCILTNRTKAFLLIGLIVSILNICYFEVVKLEEFLRKLCSILHSGFHASIADKLTSCSQ